MDLKSQIQAGILNANLPPPSPSLLTSLTTSRTPPPPLPSLIATARARLLGADLTTSSLMDASLASLPLNVPDASKGSVKLPRDVHVQVVDVENLSASRWEQVEELESVARGERTRGREVIRVEEDDDDGNEPRSQTQRPAAESTAGRNAAHRLVLQDRLGKKVFALEMERLDRVGVGKTLMGEKVLLRKGVTVARGTVLLTRDNCVFLGGKIEAWHKAWTKGRLAKLKAEINGGGPQ